MVLIVHPCADMGKGWTMHLSGQWESLGAMVDDRSIKVGRTQCTLSLDGCIFPLDVANGPPQDGTIHGPTVG